MNIPKKLCPNCESDNIQQEVIIISMANVRISPEDIESVKTLICLDCETSWEESLDK